MITLLMPMPPPHKSTDALKVCVGGLLTFFVCGSESAGFQRDLGGISDEIKHLQDKSLSMNVKLRNRKATEVKLRAFLDRVVVPPALILGLCEGPVNDKPVTKISPSIFSAFVAGAPESRQ